MSESAATPEAGEDERPSGQVEVMEALEMAALERIVSEGLGFGVREVAAVAKVNHGLVHRYYGSKDALVAAALDRFNKTIAESLDDAGRPGAAMWRQLPTLSLVLARVAIDTKEDPFGGHPVFQSWISSLLEEPENQAQRDDVIADVAVAATLAIGWGLYRTILERSIDASPEVFERADQRIRELFVELGQAQLDE